MSFDYYWRGESDEDEVIIQRVNGDTRVSLQVTEDGETSTVTLPVEEVERMIRGLQAAKAKLKG